METSVLTLRSGVTGFVMDNGDGNEDVGRELDRIRAAQAASLADDSDDDDDDDDDIELKWKRAKLMHAASQQAAGLSQQGFSQDLSETPTEVFAGTQSSCEDSLYCQQPSPAPALNTIEYQPIAVRTAYEEQAVERAFFAEYHSRQASLPPIPVPYYQVDPMSPWAPGGIMAPGGKQHIPPPTILAKPPPSSRAASPSSSARAASPASATAATKKKAIATKAKRKDPREEEELNRVIDTVINSFTPDYKHKITCEEERDVKNLEDKELHNVARWLSINKPIPRQLDLATFSSKQIRKLAQNCGVKGGGNLTLFQCRRKIAMSITMGTVYNENTIANPNTTTAERKVNTLMRLLNACFHSDMKDRFIDLNDAKKRADYEKAHGGNPVKDFWVQVSEFANDTTRNDVLGVVLESRDDEDEHLKEFVADGAFNLNDFNLQTYISCQQNISDCMKARENCLKAMRMSGHHSNDLWTYCTNNTFTKLRKSSAPVPAKAVYYCHVLCSKHPDIDGKFATFLSEKLKSDSDVDLTGSADRPAAGEDSGRSKNKTFETLVHSIASATTEMSTFFAEKKQQQKEQQQQLLLQQQEEQELKRQQQQQLQLQQEDLGAATVASRRTKLWDEYLDKSRTFLAMKEDTKQDTSILPLLCNFAIRIRELEKLCGIPSQQSVTNGVSGIPTEVFATVGTTPSTSDVTSNK